MTAGATSVKTAISLDPDLYRRADALARRMKVSRSRLFAAAMADFLDRRRNQELLAAIDAACAVAPDASEKRLRRAMRRRHRRQVHAEW
jgi:predicted transcriptional regulator